MEVSIFIPLMVAVIQSAGQVLSSFVSKAKEVASNYIFNKEFVENTIVDSADQLIDLLNAASSDLKQEMRDQSIIDVVQDLQAHVASIGELLSLVKTSEITPEMAERLITGGLLPLQVSLKKAELRLSQHGNDDMRLYCHVVGTKTLIAGYVYAGENVPTLQKDLENSIYIFQKRLLDAIAHATIQANREIPWDQVPHLLTADGISDLYNLYNSTLQNDDGSPIGESLLITPKESEITPSTPSSVRDSSGKKKVEYARKVNDFFHFNVSCSVCGFKGFPQNASECPNCKRTFL